MAVASFATKGKFVTRDRPHCNDSVYGSQPRDSVDTEAVRILRNFFRHFILHSGRDKSSSLLH